MRFAFAFTILISLFSFSLTKPATAQVMLGAYVPGDGWDVEEITRFNDASAKPLWPPTCSRLDDYRNRQQAASCSTEAES